MKWRLRRQESAHGEWSVWDPRRGYRICHYNHGNHGGTHVHFPENERALENVDIEGPQDAEAIMRRYHARHEEFSLPKLRKVIQQWKSESADA